MNLRKKSQRAKSSQLLKKRIEMNGGGKQRMAQVKTRKIQRVNLQNMKRWRRVLKVILKRRATRKELSVAPNRHSKLLHQKTGQKRTNSGCFFSPALQVKSMRRSVRFSKTSRKYFM